MENNGCEGCTTEPIEHVSCYHIPIIDKIKCPCSICLVKNMCLCGCDAHEEYLEQMAEWL
jgi:hypothetical protein